MAKADQVSPVFIIQEYTRRNMPGITDIYILPGTAFHLLVHILYRTGFMIDPAQYLFLFQTKN